MPIFEYNKLENKYIDDITELVRLCNVYEGLERYPLLQNDNLYQDMNSYYLHYEKKQLVSVLIIDQLIESEAEITGYTLPSFRRQGYFYELLEKAMDELAYFDIFKILFIVEPRSESGTLAAKSLADFDNSQYMLGYDLSKTKENLKNNSISFKEVLNLEELNKQLVDKSSIDETIEAAKFAVETENIICIEAYLDREIVGICNVSLESDSGYLFGLYVLEKYRRLGLGYTFVQYILNLASNAGKKKLTLQVGNNTPALNLYKKIGFIVLEQFDYYVLYTEVEDHI